MRILYNNLPNTDGISVVRTGQNESCVCPVAKLIGPIMLHHSNAWSLHSKETGEWTVYKEAKDIRKIRRPMSMACWNLESSKQEPARITKAAL